MRYEFAFSSGCAMAKTVVRYVTNFPVGEPAENGLASPRETRKRCNSTRAPWRRCPGLRRE
eukprot:10712031-Heterocapsa_arctica.AAC.1